MLLITDNRAGGVASTNTASNMIFEKRIMIDRINLLPL
jgi:hypothetical protein